MTVNNTLIGLKNLVSKDIKTDIKIFLALCVAVLLDALALTLALIRSHWKNPATKHQSALDYMKAEMPVMHELRETDKTHSPLKEEIMLAHAKRNRRQKVFNQLYDPDFEIPTLH